MTTSTMMGFKYYKLNFSGDIMILSNYLALGGEEEGSNPGGASGGELGI